MSSLPAQTVVTSAVLFATLSTCRHLGSSLAPADGVGWRACWILRSSMAKRRYEEVDEFQEDAEDAEENAEEDAELDVEQNASEDGEAGIFWQAFFRRSRLSR